MMTRPTVRPVAPKKEPVDLRMRARQLASSVRNGRKVMFTILDEDPHTGYLAGWDDETYFLVYEDGGRVYKDLIPKANILKITLFDERTFQEEPRYDEMNAIIRSFRDMINNNYFESAGE